MKYLLNMSSPLLWLLQELGGMLTKLFQSWRPVISIERFPRIYVLAIKQYRKRFVYLDTQV